MRSSGHNKITIFIVLNSYFEGISGGDAHTLHVVDQWLRQQNLKIYIIAPDTFVENSKRYILENRLYHLLQNADTVFLPYKDLRSLFFLARKKMILPLLVLYMYRIIISILHVLIFIRKLKSRPLAVLTLNLLPDILPSYTISTMLRSKLYVYIHGIMHLQKQTMRKSFAESLILIFDRILYKTLMKRCDILFLVQPLYKKYLESLGIEKRKIIMIWNGVDISMVQKFCENNMFTKAESNNYKVLFIGRITRAKGIYDLIHAWHLVSKIVPRARLIILGDGEEKERIEKLIKELHLDQNVELLGYVTGERKFELLSQAKLLVLPSYSEAFPITLIEAYLCGIPVVAYRLPQLLYLRLVLRDRESRIVLVEKGNVEVLYKTIVKLLTTKATKKRRITWELSSLFSWHRIAIYELEHILRNLIDKN